MRPEPPANPSEPDDDTRSTTTSWLIAQSLLVLLRVIAVVAVAVALFLLVFLGYITLPLLAPLILGIGYAAFIVWRRAPWRR
jgi:hypothetical protein